MKITTRRAAARALAALSALTLAACAGGAASTSSSKNDMIRVAVVTPQSGSFAAFGTEQREGVQFAAAEANKNGGIDGHKVELYLADSHGTPEGAVAGAQRLVQQQNTKYIIGLVSTPELGAVEPKLSAWNALMFGTQGQGDALTGESCVPGFFRVTANDSIGVRTLAAALKTFKDKQWDSIAMDYSYGQASAAGVEAALKQDGSGLGKKLFSPVGTTDFGSYISQLSGKGGIAVSLSGTDGINFFKQSLQFGLLQKYNTVLANTGLQTSTLAALNEPRLVGAWGTNTWLPTADTPGSKAFVAAYKAAKGKLPSENIGNGYLGMQTLFAGIRKARSTDPSAVGKALNGLTYDSIQGQVTMSAADHQIEAPTYIGRVEKYEGGYQLVAKQAIPASENNPQANPACKMPQQ
ncbi:MAG: hypothetical protein JWP40_4366 [Blastococcus sp.]|nr:hypothetical protein [Blastococcus sp.]